MKCNGLTDRPTNSLRFQHSLDLINICQICQIFVRFVKSYIARPSYQLLVPWHVGFVQLQIAAQTKNIATKRSENARNSKWICARVWRCFMMRHKMWMTTALKMIEAKDMEAVAPWRKLLRKSQLRDLLYESEMKQRRSRVEELLKTAVFILYHEMFFFLSTRVRAHSFLWLRTLSIRTLRLRHGKK